MTTINPFNPLTQADRPTLTRNIRMIYLRHELHLYRVKRVSFGNQDINIIYPTFVGCSVRSSECAKEMHKGVVDHFDRDAGDLVLGAV